MYSLFGSPDHEKKKAILIDILEAETPENKQLLENVFEANLLLIGVILQNIKNSISDLSVLNTIFKALVKLEHQHLVNIKEGILTFLSRGYSNINILIQTLINYPDHAYTLAIGFAGLLAAKIDTPANREKLIAQKEYAYEIGKILADFFTDANAEFFPFKAQENFDALIERAEWAHEIWGKCNELRIISQIDFEDIINIYRKEPTGWRQRSDFLMHP